MRQILWIQNDLFGRHYITDAAAVEAKNVVIDKKVAATAATVTVGLIAVGLARYFL
jgi:hypothetical protein